MRQCIVKMLSYVVIKCLFQAAIADVNDEQLSNYNTQNHEGTFNTNYFLCAEVVWILIQKLTSYILEFFFVFYLFIVNSGVRCCQQSGLHLECYVGLPYRLLPLQD